MIEMQPREFADSELWVLTRSDLSAVCPPVEHLAGIAFTKNAAIVGSEGLRQYRARHTRVDANDFTDGRFSLVIRQGDSYVAKTDPLGQDVIYYYAEPDDWAVSNSFWALCRVLGEASKKLTLYEPPLLAAFSGHSLFDQLISNRTPLQQIRVLPLNHHIVIDARSHQLSVQRVQPTSDSGVLTPKDYPDALEAYAALWTARARALVGRYAGRVTADISGGRDSRLVLGLLLAAGIDLRAIGFQSNRKLDADYAVATTLAGRYGFEIRNRGAAAPSVLSEDALWLWKAGNLGVYAPVYMPRHRQPPAILHLHGAGGGLHRQPYAHPPKRTLELVRSHFAERDQYAVVAQEFLASFIEMDVDVGDPNAMNYHYLNFRSRFHFGRNWYRQLTYPLFTPLVSSDLWRLANSLPHDRRAAGQITYDLMTLLEPSLTATPFDDPRKGFPRQIVESSPFKHARGPAGVPQHDVDYYGPVDAALPKRPDRARVINDQRAREALLFELSELGPRAMSLGFMTREYVEEARRGLESAASLAKAAKKASHVMTIGEMARLAGR